MGQCTHCGEWNTIVEEVIQIGSKANFTTTKDQKNSPQNLASVETHTEVRILTPSAELNNVLGGGLVKGSVVLLGGEPGIGKSTLVLQLMLRLDGVKVLYVSGEESAQQIKLRAERIAVKNSDCFIYTETDSQAIIKEAKKMKAELVVVDSIQTLFSPFLDAAPGSISQIKETAFELIRFAKEEDVPVILIGHITKEGTIAGPKILEHMVDVVLQFEGDRNHFFRILRALKNRFGSTQEIGIYEMTTGGLKEVKNPSSLLINKKDEPLSGNAVACGMEGYRPLLVEVQALVANSVYGTPQRSATGFDARRLSMLLAVLEKKAHLPLANKDVFLNLTGGIRLEDTALDLAVIAACISSFHDSAVPSHLCFAGEVGLNGEVRPVMRLEQRMAEAKKMGFEIICISKYNKVQKVDGIDILPIAMVQELIPILA